MRIAVSGAETSLGANTIAAVEERGLTAVALVSRYHDRTVWQTRGTRSPIVHWCDRGSLYTALRQCDVLVHCAPPAVPLDGFLHAAARAHVERVVLLSTAGTRAQDAHVDNRTPEIDLMAAEREAGFLMLGSSLRLRMTIGSPTLVVGGPEREPGLGNQLVWNYLRDPLRTTFHGGCNVISARDAGRGLALLATDGLHREKYLLGGDNITWPEFHRTISDLTGLAPPVATAASGAEGELVTTGIRHWYRGERMRALGLRTMPARLALADAVSWVVERWPLPAATSRRLVLAPEVAVFDGRWVGRGLSRTVR